MMVIDETPSEICYRYFVLKNGARITSFRVELRKVGNDVGEFITNALKTYPDDAEMYEITAEEYNILRQANRTRRMIFKNARKRNITLVYSVGANDMLSNISNFMEGPYGEI